MAEEAPALRDLDPPPPPPLGVLGELPGSCVAGRDNGDDGPAPSPEFRPGWEAAPPPGWLAGLPPPSSAAGAKGRSVSGKALVQAVRADWRRDSWASTIRA